MAYRDLQAFVNRLEEEGELKRISQTFSSELEIAEITRRVSQRHGPALLFESISGPRIPVLTNVFGSVKRMALALETESLDDLGHEVLHFLEAELKKGHLKKGRKAHAANPFEDPELIPEDRAVCQELIFEAEEVDLGRIPVLKCWPGDAGPSITLPLVFTKDPETRTRNVGMYRMQVLGRDRTAMHWYADKGGARHFQKAERQGQVLEVAVAIGPEPVMTYAATCPLPDGIDEVRFAGFLRKRPVELVRCRTVDLEVPACSQMILEGTVSPHERCLEGPFGNHTGYYSQAAEYPVFRISCITMRRDALYPATVPGPPPMEDCFMAKATERLFLPMIRKAIPGIVDINLPIEGIFNNLAFVSIKKQFPGHARKVIHDLWALGGFRFFKVICLFDADVDVQDLAQVLWRLGNNMDPLRDICFSEGPIHGLNQTALGPETGGKIGIDCTRKCRGEGFGRTWPKDVTMDSDVEARIDAIWSRLGLQ